MLLLLQCVTIFSSTLSVIPSFGVHYDLHRVVTRRSVIICVFAVTQHLPSQTVLLLTYTITKRILHVFFSLLIDTQLFHHSEERSLILFPGCPSAADFLFIVKFRFCNTAGVFTLGWVKALLRK